MSGLHYQEVESTSIILIDCGTAHAHRPQGPFSERSLRLSKLWLACVGQVSLYLPWTITQAVDDERAQPCTRESDESDPCSSSAVDVVAHGKYGDTYPTEGSHGLDNRSDLPE